MNGKGTHDDVDTVIVERQRGHVGGVQFDAVAAPSRLIVNALATIGGCDHSGRPSTAYSGTCSSGAHPRVVADGEIGCGRPVLRRIDVRWLSAKVGRSCHVPYEKDGRFVSMREALDAWEPHAVTLLINTAKKYNGFVTYKQLAETVQGQSNIRHDGLLTNWIGSVLGRVINHCVKEQVPQLSALCVKEDGTVGDGYRHVLLTRGEVIDVDFDQLDDHAAKTRLECYRYFGAELPPGGGEPTLTPRARTARDYKRAQAKMDEPPKVCPTCFMVLPVTGICDNCT
jgi:hypothetical protein